MTCVCLSIVTSTTHFRATDLVYTISDGGVPLSERRPLDNTLACRSCGNYSCMQDDVCLSERRRLENGRRQYLLADPV
jgi:hypothetical protein